MGCDVNIIKSLKSVTLFIYQDYAPFSHTWSPLCFDFIGIEIAIRTLFEQLNPIKVVRFQKKPLSNYSDNSCLLFIASSLLYFHRRRPLQTTVSDPTRMILSVGKE